MIGLHLGRRTLLAFDGHELGPRGRRRAQRHLAGCARCRSRLTRLRGLRTAAAEATALPAPNVWARIEARRGAGEIVLLPMPEPSGGAARSGSGTARKPLAAATVALAVLAGSVAAAVAVPPVRDWVSEQLATLRSSGATERVEPVAGVSVEVDGTGVVVDLPGAARTLEVSVQLEDVELLEIVGVGDAAAGEYRSGAGRVTVSGVRGGELRVVVPRSVAGPVTLTSGPDTLARAGPEGVRLPDGTVVPGLRARLADLLPGRAREERP